MGVCNCSMFCCTLLYVHSSFAFILIVEERELVVLLSLSSRCLVKVVWVFLAVPWVCLWFAVEVFPYHTHILLLAWLCVDNQQRLWGDYTNVQWRMNTLSCKQ